jgi:hypothetical protein
VGVDDLTPEEALRLYYRWWTVSVWWDSDYGIKIGPVTFVVYYWTPDRRWRLEMTWFGQPRWLFGGKLH